MIKFPIDARCTKCGNQGELKIDEEQLGNLWKEVTDKKEAEIKTLRAALDKIRDTALNGHAHPDMTTIELIAFNALTPTPECHT